MRRRRPILLLELLISILIIGIVLELLFMGYHHAILGKKKAILEKEEILNRHRLFLRLGQVFRSMDSCKKKENQFLITYDNGIDHEAPFRGMVESLLYVEGSKLLLATWGEEGATRLEVLYEGVSELELQFFDSTKGAFEKTFPKERPFMMKAILNKHLELPFFL